MTETHSHGLLAGGMDNGLVQVYSPSALMSGDGNGALITSAQKHNSAVSALDFNPIKPELLGSGSGGGQIYVWSLETPEKPTVFSPSAKLAAGPGGGGRDDITALSWNNKVEHILAAATVRGQADVWDLRSQKPVISVVSQSGFARYGDVVWSPEEPTQLVTVSNADNAPIAEFWDLKNASRPVSVMSAHTKAVLSASWCAQDPELLLTTSADARTLCWNPSTGKLLCELPRSRDGNFAVDWCPRVPALLSVCSFDNSVTFYSVQDASRETIEDDGGLDASSATHADPFLSAIGMGTGPSGDIPEAENTVLPDAPKWLKRPAGVAFGFGGQLVSFANGPDNTPRVSVAPLALDIPAISAAASLSEAVLNSESVSTFCAAKAQSVTSKDDADMWSLLAALQEDDERVALLNWLGYGSAEDGSDAKSLPEAYARLVQQVDDAEAEAETETDAQQPDADVDVAQDEDKQEGENGAGEGLPLLDTSGADDGASLFDTLAAKANSSSTPEASPSAGGEAGASSASPSASARASLPPLTLAMSPSTSSGRMTRAVVRGDWESAVGEAIEAGRAADALFLAASGGPDLYARTRAWYVDQSRDSLLRLVAALPSKEQPDHDRLRDIVASANLADWKAILAVLTTFATGDEYGSLCHDLGVRLASTEPGASESAAIIAYLCAGTLEPATNLWIRASPLSRAEARPAHGRDDAPLVELMEKTMAARVAICAPAMPSVLSPALVDFAQILTDAGQHELAFESLSQIDALASAGPDAELYDRLFFSGRVDVQDKPYPPFPFPNAEDVINDPPAEAYAAGQDADPYAADPYAADPYAADPYATTATAAATTTSTTPATAKVAPTATTTAYEDPFAETDTAQYDFYGTSSGAGTATTGGGAGGQDPYAADPYAAASAHTAAANTRKDVPVGPPMTTGPPRGTGPTVTRPAAGIVRPAGNAQAEFKMFDPSKQVGRKMATETPRGVQGPKPDKQSIGSVSSGGYGDAPSYPEPTFKYKRAAVPPPVAPVATGPPVPQAGGGVPASNTESVAPPPRAGGPPPSGGGGGGNGGGRRRVAPPPEPVAPVKSAPGDVSKVPASLMPIVSTIKSLLGEMGSVAKRVEKKKLDQVHKKTLILFQQLNDGELSPALAEGMLALCAALNDRNYPAALELQMSMIASEYTDWLVGIKFLIQVAKKLLPPQ